MAENENLNSLQINVINKSCSLNPNSKVVNTVTPETKNSNGIIDTGATRHYGLKEDPNMQDIHPATTPIKVMNPNDMT